LRPADVAALQQARAAGAADPMGVARGYYPGDREKAHRGGEYLRDNIQFRLGDRERAGLERFFALAAEVGVVPAAQELRWF
jgi:hypothetical protein